MRETGPQKYKFQEKKKGRTRRKKKKTLLTLVGVREKGVQFNKTKKAEQQHGKLKKGMGGKKTG